MQCRPGHLPEAQGVCLIRLRVLCAQEPRSFCWFFEQCVVWFWFTIWVRLVDFSLSLFIRLFLCDIVLLPTRSARKTAVGPSNGYHGMGPGSDQCIPSILCTMLVSVCFALGGVFDRLLLHVSACHGFLDAIVPNSFCNPSSAFEPYPPLSLLDICGRRVCCALFKEVELQLFVLAAARCQPRAP